MKNNLLIAIVAVSALLAGYWFSTMQLEAESNAAAKHGADIQGAVINPARKVGVPALIQDDGSVLTADALKGHWSLIFFGYTNCPDVCPTTMNVLAQAKKAAEKSNPTMPFPDVYFVSVDPQRDTPEQLASYVKYFDKTFTGVTGKDALIKAFTLQLSAVYLIMAPEDATKPDVYNVDHSSTLYLLNEDGKLAALLSEPFSPGKLVDDIKRVQTLADIN